jgi:glycosyltransferase involved in cell wall biosynthesis
MQKPFLSIVMLTYGHEKFIRQAIDGVFLQKTNFNLELIIANDHSPDETDRVVKSMQNSTPSHITIQYTQHEKNLGMMTNFTWALHQAKGKYVAICEGDDYWTDSLKLQKQVDFLEENPEFSIHCHNFKTQNENRIDDVSHFDSLTIKQEMTIEDLAKTNVIPTLSAVFRNQKIIFPDWSYNAPLGDIILFLQIAKNGKIKYLNEKMAVYRQNVGVWSGKKMNQKKMAELYENLAADYKDLPEVHQNLIRNRNKHSKAFLKEEKFLKMLIQENFTKLNLIEKIKLIIQRIL